MLARVNQGLAKNLSLGLTKAQFGRLTAVLGKMLARLHNKVEAYQKYKKYVVA